ncbi:MAG: S8 family serine peptidase, partial [Planctomycetota bacterium]
QQGGLWIETEVPPNGPYDDLYHGTASAGTIGGKGNNLQGITGVAWDACIMAVKCMNENGQGWSDDIYNSVHYAVDMGADIINCSWVGNSYSYYISGAIAYARDNGVLCIIAAGNSGTNVDEDPTHQGYPAVYEHDNMVVVGSSDVDDHLVGKGPKSFGYGSNYGPISVDVSAPGCLGVTTEPMDLGNGGYRNNWSGTSMAMPHVVGMAALAWSQDPSQTYADVRDRIFNAVDGKPQLDNIVRTGGRMNLHHLVRTDGGPPTPVTDLAAASLWFDRIKMVWHESFDDPNAKWPASLYDLRYSTQPVTEANFDSATPAIGEFQPVKVGGIAQCAVTGLEPDMRYYFLMKTKDHHGNSCFSNAATAMTLTRPLIDDLTLVGEGLAYVDLSFTVPEVPGSDVSFGFSDLDLRFAFEPINTEAEFLQATQVEDLPEVAFPGMAMTLRVEPLHPGMTYWFAVRLTDIFEIKTPVSNTISGTPALPDTVVFMDDMESGIGGWQIDPAVGWGLTDEAAASGTWSWKTFPYAYYPPNWEGSLISPALDLSGFTWAGLYFNEILWQSIGETTRICATRDNGVSWFVLKENTTYQADHGDWLTRYVDLSLFAGEPDVRLCFTLTSDGYDESDGWYIDDVLVGGSVAASTEYLSDDFESGTSNWTVGDHWALADSDSHSPSHAMQFHMENLTGIFALDSTQLSMTQPPAGSLFLTFWHRFSRTGTGGLPRVFCSIDGGLNWNVIFTGLALADDDSWTFKGVNLTEYYEGQNIQSVIIRFQGRGGASATVDWFVDDVRLFEVEGP